MMPFEFVGIELSVLQRGNRFGAKQVFALNRHDPHIAIHLFLFCRHRYPSFRLFFLVFYFTIFYGFFQDGDVRTRYFLQKIRIFTFLPFIQYHEIGENSTKVLDFSILLRYTAQRQKRRNCKYRSKFCKSVQAFHAKVVCPTFWDRPP